MYFIKYLINKDETSLLPLKKKKIIRVMDLNFVNSYVLVSINITHEIENTYSFNCLCYISITLL